MEKSRFFFVMMAAMLVLSSCTPEFSQIAEYKDITIVYGLLNISEDTQYVKIQKAFLTEGNAYAALVDVPSTRRTGYMRVESGNAEASLLHLILREGGEDLLSHNHTEILSSQFKTNLEEVSALIDQWIEQLKP